MCEPRSNGRCLLLLEQHIKQLVHFRGNYKIFLQSLIIADKTYGEPSKSWG